MRFRRLRRIANAYPLRLPSVTIAYDFLLGQNGPKILIQRFRMPFSKDGAGYWLGDLFDCELGGQLCASGDASGTTLMVLSDFGGSHAGQLSKPIRSWSCALKTIWIG
jgi:hypothetical protein